jgi:hypothetical protein
MGARSYPQTASGRSSLCTPAVGARSGSLRVNMYVPSASRLSLRSKAKQNQLMRDQKEVLCVSSWLWEIQAHLVWLAMCLDARGRRFKSSYAHQFQVWKWLAPTPFLPEALVKEGWGLLSGHQRGHQTGYHWGLHMATDAGCALCAFRDRRLHYLCPLTTGSPQMEFILLTASWTHG